MQIVVKQKSTGQLGTLDDKDYSPDKYEMVGNSIDQAFKNIIPYTNVGLPAAGFLGGTILSPGIGSGLGLMTGSLAAKGLSNMQKETEGQQIKASPGVGNAFGVYKPEEWMPQLMAGWTGGNLLNSLWNLPRSLTSWQNLEKQRENIAKTSPSGKSIPLEPIEKAYMDKKMESGQGALSDAQWSALIEKNKNAYFPEMQPPVQATQRPSEVSPQTWQEYLKMPGNENLLASSQTTPFTPGQREPSNAYDLLKLSESLNQGENRPPSDQAFSSAISGQLKQNLPYSYEGITDELARRRNPPSFMSGIGRKVAYTGAGALAFSLLSKLLGLFQ